MLIDYVCTKCDNVFEVWSDEDWGDLHCGDCGAEMKKESWKKNSQRARVND